MTNNIFTGTMPALMTPAPPSASRTSTPWCARAAN